MKIAAVIQARMGSKRFPGKVLDDIAGIPMLHHIIERARYAHELDAVVIATTTNPDDRILLKRAREWQVIGFAGPEHDVLKRCLTASNLAGANIMVRITADNPLFEPSFIDKCIAKLRDEGADYCSVEGCILGTGVEVMKVEALKKADSLATRPSEREHVTPYIIEHPDMFKVVSITPEKRYRMPEGVRLTVDTDEDMKLVRRIYRRLYHEGRIVSLGRTVELLKENPEWVGLNKDVFQKLTTSSELEEAEAAEAEKAEAPEAPPAPEPPAKPKPLLGVLKKKAEKDKLDKLMAEAKTKEAEEAKLKEQAPTLDDVLAHAQSVPEKPADSSELDKLFVPDAPDEEVAEETPEEPEQPEASGQSEEPEVSEEIEQPKEPKEPEEPPAS